MPIRDLRFAIMERGTAWVGVLVVLSLVIAGGCSSPPPPPVIAPRPELPVPPPKPATITLRFRDLKRYQIDEKNVIDQWTAIEPILRSFHIPDNIYGVEFFTAPDGDPRKLDPENWISLYNQKVVLVISDGSRLCELHSKIVNIATSAMEDIPEIRQQMDQIRANSTGPDTTRRLGRFHTEAIELGILEGGLVYTANTATIDIQVLVSGATKPDAKKVALYLPDVPDAENPVTVPVDANGHFTRQIHLTATKHYIYGYSQDKDFQTTYFRLNIFSALQESIPQSRFEALRRAEP